MKKLTSYELRQIFAWADNERTLEGFWHRVVIASAAYPLYTQLKIAELANRCLDLGDLRK